MRDYYEVLELPRSASDADIRKAYRRLALRWHPDRNPGDASAEERFKELAEAYSVLIDTNRRRMYDRDGFVRFGQGGGGGGGGGGAGAGDEPTINPYELFRAVFGRESILRDLGPLAAVFNWQFITGYGTEFGGIEISRSAVGSAAPLSSFAAVPSSNTSPSYSSSVSYNHGVRTVERHINGVLIERTSAGRVVFRAPEATVAAATARSSA